MRTLKPALLYTGLAFVAGFAFGTLRELYLRPRFGHDAALTIEAPFMILASLLAARYALRRFPLAAGTAVRLRMGALALALLLLCEEALTRVLRGGSVFEYWAGYDAWAQAVNVAGLVAFLAMPALLGRRRAQRPESR